jgi:hypothetical protein
VRLFLNRCHPTPDCHRDPTLPLQGRLSRNGDRQQTFLRWLDNVPCFVLIDARPARQRGTSGGVWSWGGIARCKVRLKRPERAGAVGRSQAPQGEELWSDAALSPGRHSPGALRVPRLPGSGTFQGVPPALAEASSVPSSPGWVRAETRLRPPREGRSARPGIKAPPSAGCPGQGCARHLAPGPWPCHPRLHTPQMDPCRPRAPNPRGGSCAADPSRRTPRSPLSCFSEGRERAGPHASDPDRAARRRSHASKRAKLVARGAILGLQPRHEIGGADDPLDGPDALAGTPDVAPGLRLAAA